MGPLEGLAVIPDVKHQLDKISVYFGIDWDARHPCEETVHLRYPPNLPPDVKCLIHDLDLLSLEKYLPTVANIAPEQLFDNEPLDEDAFIFGGSTMNTKDVSDDDDPYFSQNDFCLVGEIEEQGFQDCPIPVIEAGIVFGDISSTLVMDVLIDSGATLNLMSQDFVRQMFTADGPIVRHSTGAR
jgi:hypothetical protein